MTTLSTLAPAASEAPTRSAVASARRRIRRALAILVASVAVVVAMAGPASANADTDYCVHGVRTYIGSTLPAGNSGGITLDLYLYRYTSSGWTWTGASQRLYGSRYGYWTTTSGHMTMDAQFNAPRGSGYYLIRSHAFNGGVGSWSWILGYDDDFRGATTYCLS
jgi:hypothetical protein